MIPVFEDARLGAIPHDLSRIDAAFFTMNGYVSVIFFVFWAADIFWA